MPRSPQLDRGDGLLLRRRRPTRRTLRAKSFHAAAATRSHDADPQRGNRSRSGTLLRQHQDTSQCARSRREVCATTRCSSRKRRTSIRSPRSKIAANDVKAYHGATVGAISADEIFYAQTRGLSRSEAERMIALGFLRAGDRAFPDRGFARGTAGRARGQVSCDGRDVDDKHDAEERPPRDRDRQRFSDLGATDVARQALWRFSIPRRAHRSRGR